MKHNFIVNGLIEVARFLWNYIAKSKVYVYAYIKTLVQKEYEPLAFLNSKHV